MRKFFLAADDSIEGIKKRKVGWTIPIPDGTDKESYGSQYEALFKENLDDENDISDPLIDTDGDNLKGQRGLGRNKADTTDEDRIRSMVQRIHVASEESNVHVRRKKEASHNNILKNIDLSSNTLTENRIEYIDSSRRDLVYSTAEESAPSFFQIPKLLADWENDVQVVMTGAEQITVSSSNQVAPLKFMRQIDFEVAPYSCFDPDAVDLDNMKDPLDCILSNDYTTFTIQKLNREFEESLHNSILSGKTESGDSSAEFLQSGLASGSRIEDPVRTELFNRFCRFAALEQQVEEGDAAPTKQEILMQQKREKIERIRSVNASLDTTGTILKNNRKKKSDAAFNDYTRAMIASVNHNPLATNHRNSKVDLSELELKYFHRPRMLKERDRTWEIKVRPKSTKLHGVSASINKRNISKPHQSLSLVSGDHKFILVEYCEEFPPALANLGMASLMVNFYRSLAEGIEGQNEADKDNIESDISFEKLRRSLEANNLRLPRHVMLLWQLKKIKSSYEHDADVPRLAMGQTKVLNSGDESPFLGVVEEGHMQPALINGLFRAPLFQHKVHPTDFLLVRTKQHRGTLDFVLREIPYIFLCGQTEPMRIVPRPLGRVSTIQDNHLALVVSRLLGANYTGLTTAEIEATVLKYSGKETTAPHKSALRSAFREVLRKVGEEVRGKWFPVDWTDDPDEVLARAFSPEDVCLQESCNAAEYRLRQQFITNVDLTKVQAYLHHLHKVKQFYRQRIERIKAAVGHSNDPQRMSQLDSLIQILQRDIQRLDVNTSIARFIFDRLVSAPWNTTEAFVQSVINKDNMGMMELQGIGDPSGRGEGFSFVRLSRIDDSGNHPASTTLVGTDKDLRRLKKIEAIKLLVSFGVSHAAANKLERWDRIHMIREFVNKLEKAGASKELKKFVRDVSLLKGKGEMSEDRFRDLCVQIWQRQKLALESSTSPNVSNLAMSEDAQRRERKKRRREEKMYGGGEQSPFSASSEGSSSDFDSDSEDSDIEDLEEHLKSRSALAATTKGSGSGGSTGGAADSSRGATGSSSSSSSAAALNRADDDDETAMKELSSLLESKKTAAEAGQLQHRPKVRIAGVEGGNDAAAVSFSSEGGAASASSSANKAAAAAELLLSSWTPPKRVVKRITRVTDKHGKESVRIEFVFEEQEVRRVELLNNKQRREKQQKRLYSPFLLSQPTATAASSGGAAGGGRRRGHQANDWEGDMDGDDDAIALTRGPAALTFSLKPATAVADSSSGRRGGAFRDDAGFDEEEALVVTKTTSRSKSAAETINFRTPRISFAARLEIEVLHLWHAKNASPFWYPVDLEQVPGYATIVSQPICLMDIREKIVRYEYETGAALLADVQLMADNAEKFNGSKHTITKTGHSLVRMLKEALEHDRKHFGAEGDAIALLEDAIRRRKRLLNSDTTNSG